MPRDGVDDVDDVAEGVADIVADAEELADAEALALVVRDARAEEEARVLRVAALADGGALGASVPVTAPEADCSVDAADDADAVRRIVAVERRV